MDRKQVLLDDGQMARQREFTEKIHDIHRARGRTPLAMVDTFGCQQNVADSQHILGMLRDMGCDFTDDPARADIVVMNTCAIRDHAEKRVYGTLGALTHTKKANPEQIICLCGCMAQRPEVARKVRESYRHVDLVFGPQALWKFPELLYQVYTRRGRVFSVENEHGSIAEGMPVVREGRVRAWVSIMYGCNNFCSYCIVPYVRGRERSRSPEKIVEEVRQLAAEGYKEITLLGQNVNSYGKDLGLGVDFADLMAEIAQLPGEFWLRFMTSHPKDASKKLFDTIAKYPKIAKQFHLPFQSGNDRVLKAMNRHYNREEYLKLAHYGRQIMPELVLTSDVIVGFPGETEEDFLETMDVVRKVRYDSAFTFQYSRRTGTPAAAMEDQIPVDVVKDRFDRLLAEVQEISREVTARHTHTVQEVLVESINEQDPSLVTGRMSNNTLVHFKGDASLIGTLQNVYLDECRGFYYMGTPVENN